MPKKRAKAATARGSDGGGPSAEHDASEQRPRSISLSSPSAAVGVALLSKNVALQHRVEFGGASDLFRLGDIYLNDLSDLRVFELSNSKPRRLRVQLKAELRKPFHASVCHFQLENENLNLDQAFATRSEAAPLVDEYNHVPASVVRASTKAALCAENAYLSEGYNELFNQIATVHEVVLEQHETKRVVFSLCTKFTNSGAHVAPSQIHADSSEEERLHLNETSCLMLTGRLTVKARYEDLPVSAATMPRMPSTPPLPLSDVVVPLQGQVCRSLLRLDVKELHFDDCIPGGSFVKDFTVWNRSEIPLLFELVSPVAMYDDTRELLSFTDYNSGYRISGKIVQAAAYGHVRIRVTYRPLEIGERFFEVQVQNLHDARNAKTLKIHAVTNKEHHREGLSIKEPSGSYLMSGSKLDFGDCYSGIATCKTLLIKNTTEASLHVELTSDRAKEVTFELKLLSNRSRSARVTRTEDALSPTDSNEDSSRKGSLSPGAAAKAAVAFSSFDNSNNYAADSDEEGDDNEGEFYDDDMALAAKRLSFEENPLGDLDDGDDDFEFDRQPRPSARSPPISPKTRSSTRAADSRRRVLKKKVRQPSRLLARLRDGAYESGVDSGSVCSSPERKSRGELRRRNSASIDDSNGSNFLVETIDLPPGVERTILVWYCPTNADWTSSYDDGVDSKASRLSKQTFRVSFRCFQLQGSWQQAQSRVYDRTLGKSIHIRARTCTSIVTATPSILHLGDCNIGELKNSACVLTNHSELPTTVKPLVTSKVISTVPNDEIVLGPKQSLELKVEIIPRKINPNYSRLISIVNTKNKANIPQICVRSSNMDAHHVIYHSLFYKLLTPSRSAFLNFDHVAINSIGIQVFDLENITGAPLPLSLQTSDPSRVRLYVVRQPSDGSPMISAAPSRKQFREDQPRSGSDKFSTIHASLSSTSLSSQSSNSRLAVGGNSTPSNTSTPQGAHRPPTRIIRRRRSFGCEAELSSPVTTQGGVKRNNGSAVLRGYLSKKVSLASATASSGWLTGTPAEAGKSTKNEGEKSGNGAATPPIGNGALDGNALERVISKQRGSLATMSLGTSSSGLDSLSTSSELQALLDLYEFSRIQCDRYSHSTVASVEKELEIAGMIRERARQFQSLVSAKKLVLLAGVKDRNTRIPAKSRQRIIAVFTPSSDLPSSEAVKLRIEKLKIFITLPPGGNKKAVTDAARFDASKATWATSKHPFDSRPSVRELLVKGRVCRSVMNVNQKNINFGRITVSSRSSKKLIVQNMSAIPLIYSVEKTGSISSAFLEIKEGEVGVVKGFGTKEICFEFQPTLAGPFEEKLKITNVQDPENTINVTIKAKVVKRETFKLLQSGQVLSFGKCLAGEKSEVLKIAVRNTSRKKREYAIQVDTAFSNPLLRPTFYFSVDDAPSANITQAQEKKLDEELEKLEHKLRIAVTKKKAEKISKLNSKISRVKALLNGEQVADEVSSDVEDDTMVKPGDGGSTDFYESNSESEVSESDMPPRVRSARRQLAREGSADKMAHTSIAVSSGQSTPGVLQFTLEGEAVGRIVAYAVFQPVRPAQALGSDDLHGASSADHGGNSASIPRSQKARKRQLRREVAPLVGVGKLLLFEQQNKDVVKELQYNAEVFLRTPAAEAAYYRLVGKSPLPPVPHGALSKRPSLRRMIDSDDGTESGGLKSEHDKITAPTKAQVLIRDKKNGPSTSIDPSPTNLSLTAVLDSDEGTISRRPTLLVPLEECPKDAVGWYVTLRCHHDLNYRSETVAEVRWRPAENFQGLISIVGAATPIGESVGDTSTEFQTGDEAREYLPLLPLRVAMTSGHAFKLNCRWNYSAGSGFGSSTAIASCISSSTLDLVSRSTQVTVGNIEIVEVDVDTNDDFDGAGHSVPRLVSTIDVALVKAATTSLHLEPDVVDLGQQEQNNEVKGEFVLKNRSRQVVKFLLLTPSILRDQQNNSSAVGELFFESSTGKVEALSSTTVRFTFRGAVPGQHLEQILVRNLNDRLDCLTVNVSVHVTRPVYVRIPELDPHATGTLNVLDLGPCYVTPEMQDTSVDSPNVSLKFSKVHKLTLVSQVEETLVLCASSNLKTQCYVYEDLRLHREATQVVLAGKKSVDLFVAVRPRLPGDAFKSGACRELVGGIRVQLFRSIDVVTSAEVEEKVSSSMVAEFTVKFVGIAGASLSRVVPSTIEFIMESPSSFLHPVKRDGQIEIVNISKALPLVYKLFLVSDTEGYSDTDQTLRVDLPILKGEIEPGGTGFVQFQVSASTFGLFRRRILVENAHYPGKISSIDLVLFVDNKSLQCSVVNQADIAAIDVSQSSGRIESVDMGFIPVIKMEDELADVCGYSSNNRPSGLTESESSFVQRQYRICAEAARFVEDSDVKTAHCLVLTNTQNKGDLILRPISTLPLCFQWSDSHVECSQASWLQIQPTAYFATLHHARYLQLGESHDEKASNASPTIFYGGVFRLAPKASCRLFFRFATIAGTSPLHVDSLSCGKSIPLTGMISIQSFSSGSANAAKTLRTLSLQGKYAESLISIGEKAVSLGKVGYSLGWRSTQFDVIVKNVSDMPAYFSVVSFSEMILLKEVVGASAVVFDCGRASDRSGGGIPSLSALSLKAASGSVWKLQASETCVVTMEFVQTASVLTAGIHEFDAKIFNLLNAHNVEAIQISAQIVSSYADVTVDPESSGGSIGIGNEAAEIGFLPPVTVPPISDSTGSNRGPSFWFSIKNVFDEELSVTLVASLYDQFQSIADLSICSRSSNTPLSSISVPPGESTDIRVVCRVHPFARITPELFAASDQHYIGDLLTFGSINLDITVQNMKDATQHKQIIVRGKVLPGKTFTVSSSSLHFRAVASDLPQDIPIDSIPPAARTKVTSSRELSSSTMIGDPGKSNLYQLRNQSETFWIRNPSTTQPLNFVIDQIPMHSPGLLLIKGSSASEMYAMSEYIQAAPIPASGSIPPGEATKITVRLEETTPLVNDNGSADSTGATINAKALLHKMRHHPSWRSNSWGAEVVESSSDPNPQSHMFLTVRDVDMSSEAALVAEIDVHLLLQTNLTTALPGSDSSKVASSMDRSLVGAAFAAREKRLAASKPTLSLPLANSSPQLGGRPMVREQMWGDGSMLDHFEELDIGSIRSGSVRGRKNQQSTLSVRGCTPSENSALESTRYVIDVGQHTVRNGGEVEWEITVESAFSQIASDTSGGSPDSVEYRLYPVDQSASSWIQLSRDRGTLDRSRSYQNVVLYFLRDTIGVYSTFLVLQNVSSPGDLKIIQVKLEVVADLNALRSMTSGIDPSVHLFRVLVSSQSALRKVRRLSDEMKAQSSASPGSAANQLVVDFGEVYYHKLYHNHSIVIENSSSMTLDFTLSSTAPSEISFSVSPTSFTEVSTVTLGARGRTQVFIHLRPRPLPVGVDSTSSSARSDPWSREFEVYVNCRLVKDFRETVVLRALCYSPQLTVHVAPSAPESTAPIQLATMHGISAQPTFLGVVFAMSESALALSNDIGTDSAGTENHEARYLVVHNTRDDARARIALRNDSLFFTAGVVSDQAGTVEVDYLENGICAGRRSTLLVSIAPRCSAVFRVVPDVQSLRKHRQVWDHSVKEHITLYNIKQFAEHYQVTLCFTCSNVTSYYIPPHIVESYPFSALEDTIAKFLQNYNATWKWLISYHSKAVDNESTAKTSTSMSITRLAEVLGELEQALEESSPLSPRKPNQAAGFEAAPPAATSEGPALRDRKALHQLLQSYRALYFDFFYITDELIWYGVRSNAVRHSLMLADLAYGVVFSHEIFRAFLSQTNESLIFPRLLLPWSRQLRHFLSFFPENQEATRPLRQVYEQLQKFELAG